MYVTDRGPTLNTLRRRLGTRDTVSFGTGDDNLDITVELLAAVGNWDLPISLPRDPKNESNSVWYVAGSGNLNGVEVAILALVSFTTSGRYRCAVVLYDYAEESAQLVTALELNRMFAAGARALLAIQE